MNETKVYHPFPISITNAVVIKNHLVATWVDHELRLARMAAIPLENGFEEGPRRGDLRAQGNASPLQVAGAAWSHTLDSEPVAMACDEETVYFALWTREYMLLTSTQMRDGERKSQPFSLYKSDHEVMNYYHSHLMNTSTFGVEEEDWYV